MWCVWTFHTLIRGCLFDRVPHSTHSDGSNASHTVEDLWHAFNLIRVGDRITATTFRKIQRDSGVGAESEKVKLTLTIAVEDVDFDPQGTWSTRCVPCQYTLCAMLMHLVRHVDRQSVQGAASVSRDATLWRTSTSSSVPTTPLSSRSTVHSPSTRLLAALLCVRTVAVHATLAQRARRVQALHILLVV